MKKKEIRSERFAREYVIDLNGEKAAIRAGYSPKTARAQASRLLTKGNVKAIIEADSRSVAEKLGIKAETVLRELQLMGMANMLDYVQPQENGTMRLDFSKITREQGAAIQEITTEEFSVPGEDDEDTRIVTKMKFKLSDKRSSLELLGKHLSLFADKTEISGPGGGPIPIEIVSRIPRPVRGSSTDNNRNLLAVSKTS